MTAHHFHNFIFPAYTLFFLFQIDFSFFLLQMIQPRQETLLIFKPCKWLKTTLKYEAKTYIHNDKSNWKAISRRKITWHIPWWEVIILISPSPVYVGISIDALEVVWADSHHSASIVVISQAEGMIFLVIQTQYNQRGDQQWWNQVLKYC